MFHLITGGSGSGKSRYAEEQILALGEKNRIYIATMRPYGEEGEERIRRHRKLREGKGFETMECFRNLNELEIPEGSCVLLECLSNLVANEVFEKGGAGLHTIDHVLYGIEHLLDEADDVVVVTNEIFSDGMKYPSETKIYMEFLGALNQELAAMADQVTEVVVGIPVPIKR